MIKTLHVLRGFAALAIVFYHLDIPLPGGTHTDLFGVAIFLTISGFLMCLTTQKTADNFMLKRSVRILPTYWVAMLATIIWYGSGLANPFYTVPTVAHMLRTDPGNVAPFLYGTFVIYLSPEILQRFALSFVLWPKTASFTPTIGVGWTLTVEMVCYAIFGLSLRLSRKHSVAVAFCIVSATFLIASAWISPNQQLWLSFGYLPPFAAGLIVYYVWKYMLAARRPRKVIFLSLGAACAAVYSYLVVYQVALSGRLYSDYLAGCASLVIVTAALLIEKSGVRFSNRILQLLGTSSYSLYLIHSQIIDALRTLWQNTPFPDPHRTMGGLAVVMAICVLFGFLFYHFIERPLVAVGHQIVASLGRSRAVILSSETVPDGVL